MGCQKIGVFRHPIVAGAYFLQGSAAPMCQKIRCFDIRSSPGPIFYKDPKKGGFQKVVCFDIRSLPGPIFYNKKFSNKKNPSYFLTFLRMRGQKIGVFRHPIVAGTYFLQGSAPPMCQKVVCFDIRSLQGPIFYEGRRRRCAKN